MYTIIPHKRVVKFLQRHPDLARQFVEKAEIMQIDPFDNRLDIKQLEKDFYRLRIGDYRFLYVIEYDTLKILVVDGGSRWDIYKKLKSI
jgi:mRNA interferase RelE/StbE